MRLNSIFILVFVTLLLFASCALGQEASFNPDRTVMPIGKLTVVIGGVGEKAGTGFCLDPTCKFVGTNYHVAVFLGSSLSIRGENVTERYLASSPDDEGATINRMMDFAVDPMTYNMSRDFAVFGLKHPLANRGMRGIPLSLDDLVRGQEVDIYAYPSTTLYERLPVKRHLTRFPAKYAGENEDGLLAFNLESTAPSIKPGASGGLIIDRKTQQAVGVLIGTAKGNMAVAVSIQTVADFLRRTKPDLFAELFPSELRDPLLPEQLQADLYPQFVPTANPSGVLHHRQEESADVKRLREKAQELADSMKDFIAIETLSYGGMRRPPPPSQYEIRMIDGDERYRKYPDGKKELRDLPFPPTKEMVLPGSAWSTSPMLVGSELNLKIVQAQETVINGRKVKVFQYHGDTEDNACGFRHIMDFVLFQRVWTRMLSCSGEVWTDEALNILRISENQDLPPAAGWQKFHAAATYGRLNQSGESDRLIPISVAVEAEYKGKVYWSVGRFTNYRVFTARARLLQ
jgi:hypothetical protein